MKKLLVLLLVAAMSLGMLTACGDGQQETNEEGNGGSEDSEGEDVSTGENGEEPEGEVTQVTYWNSASGEKTFVEEIVDEFNETIGKENNVEIVLEHIESATSSQEIEVAFQNGVGPDIFGVADLSAFAEKGWIVPLTEVPGLEELVEKNNWKKLGTNVWQDEMYSIAESRTIYGLVYNKDMFVEAGLVDENGEAAPPTTIEEMVEYAKILTDSGSQKFGFAFPLGWGVTVDYYLNFPSQSSSGLVNGNYDYKTGMYDFEGIKDMAAAVLQMKEDGSLYPGAETLDNDAARARFAEGNIGMMMTVQWDCAVWNDQFPAKCDWGVAAIPVADETKAYQQASGVSGSYSISARGIEEGRGDAIALVFNYLYSDEMMARRAEEGIKIPWRADIVEMCDFTNSPKGWEDYCNLAAISVDDTYPRKTVDLDGLDNFETTFINDVWSGNQSLDDWLAAMTERYNEAAERYIENAAEDVAAEMQSRMDPNFDISR